MFPKLVPHRPSFITNGSRGPQYHAAVNRASSLLPKTYIGKKNAVSDDSDYPPIRAWSNSGNSLLLASNNSGIAHRSWTMSKPA